MNDPDRRRISRGPSRSDSGQDHDRHQSPDLDHDITPEQMHKPGESSYPAASGTELTATPLNANDAPFEVRIEFVMLDGPAGQELRRRQANIMRKVLRWIAEHPDPADR